MSVCLRKSKEIEVKQCDLIFDFVFNPKNDNICLLSTVDGDIVMIDSQLETNSTVLTLDKHHKGSAIRKVRLHDDLLITAAKTIKIYDLNKGKVVRKIDNDGCKIYSLLVIDNYLLCYGDDEGNFKVFDYRVDRGVHMNIKECDDYISDLDIDSNKRVVVASSGEGTLSAFNIRAKKLEPPQSELFDSGFQCVRYMESKNKVLVGAEDGAINIFNINEWGNISDRFPIRGQNSRCKGGCSVDNIEIVDTQNILASSSDGKLRLVSILPNKILQEVSIEKMSIEALALNGDKNKVAVAAANFVIFHDVVECEKNSSKSTNNEFFSDI
ncbi:WD repeat-containing protein 55-like protein [Dinothrombium tinctorium]|uniref:WD repeat-containing protein 55-like protein n=1 Tax=Dinothrombium tinctorium TaxID=1965070 RepID=A0A3S3SQB4_9ACAR|nr:WD repeat-containing protein 55-like protein [Dinothrombium tinctorium]RWS17509.1 WD repeat-containing protein 55-like protein [Dinothrombium tinctorium]RWS17530.1 WD repeat-containing protein 55-like protein [Dinothrombium tinctorium]